MFLRARRIFISHSSHDDELATRLGQRLAARGLSPIVDHHPRTGIQPGQDWLRSLQDHLGRAHAVILLVTDEWRASAWCQAEHRAAKLLKKTIIPIVPEPKLHADIEPSLQRIVLRPERSAGTDTPPGTAGEISAVSTPAPPAAAGDIPDHVVEAIVAALPSRALANVLMAAPVVLLLAGATIGVRATPDGRWDAAALRGGTFVDLRLDARGAPHMAALATDLFGRRGLHVSADCGDSWSESALPAGLDKPRRLDFTSDEILVASESGLWILDRARGSWTRVDTGGAGDSVVFGRVDPGQPHNVIYGIQDPGGTTASAGTGGSVGGAVGELRAGSGSGGMTILDRRTSTRRSFPFQMNDVAFNPQHPNRVAIAAARGGVFISRNGLTTVVPIAAPDLDAPLIVAFDRTGTIVYAGGRGGLVSFLFPVTPDAPIDVRRHLTMPSGAAVHGLWMESDGRVLIATTVGLFTLANRETEATPFAPTPFERHVNNVVRCGDRLAVATGGAGVQSLSDGATEWQSLLDSGANLPAFSGISTETFRLASGGAYLFRSFDDGGSYQGILAPGVNATAMSASLAAPSSGAAASDALHTRSPAARASAHYTASSIVAGLGTGRILRKAPGAIEWTDTTPKDAPCFRPFNAVVRSTAKPEIVLGVCPGRAPLLSEDDGVTWTMLEGAGLDRTLTAFALADGRFLVAGVEDVKGADAQRGLMRAIDPRSRAVVAGPTRTARPITGYVFDVDRQVSIAVDAAGTVYRVDGANLSTQELAKLRTTSPDGFVDLFCCDDAGYAYAGAKGMGVWRSIDGGRQWQHVVLRTLDADAEIFAIGSGPLGKPTFYSNRGLLQAVSDRRVCLTDTLCLEWSQDVWRSRVGRIIPFPSRK